MKKVLALGLSVALVLALGVTALAVDLPAGWTPADGARGELPQEVDVPVPAAFSGVITVDGVELDTTAIPGAPGGYLPMRAICEASGAYVSWFPEENQSLFVVDEHSVLVSLSDLSIVCDAEPVEGFTAYLDPSGYTFLPMDFLTTFENFKVNANPELSSVRYDITTVVERSGVEALAYAIMEAAQTGKLMELDAQIMEENYFFHMDAYEELVAYQPMMTAQPTTIVIAQVKDGQMDTAKADFQAYLEAVKGTLGFYPACAEALEKAQTVESPDGKHLMLVSTWENNDDAVKLFNETFVGK